MDDILNKEYDAVVGLIKGPAELIKFLFVNEDKVEDKIDNSVSNKEQESDDVNVKKLAGTVGALMLTTTGIGLASPLGDATVDISNITSSITKPSISTAPVSTAVSNEDVTFRTSNKSISNYNYGNIRSNSSDWLGASGTWSTSHGEFVKFKSPFYGVRAAMYNLYGYGSKRVSGKKGKNLKTVKDIINVYAPPSENDTENYIKFVCAQTGLKKNQKIDVSTQAEHLKAILKAILRMESGVIISDDLLDRVHKALTIKSTQASKTVPSSDPVVIQTSIPSQTNNTQSSGAISNSVNSNKQP